MRLRATRLTAIAGAVRRMRNAFADASAVYSVRIPRGGTYSGPLLRVRRSSDNAEQDIGAVVVADANGDRWLDESAMLAFVGAGSGFVVTWYDQSGFGRNISQEVQGSQPILVVNGVINRINARPTLFFNGTSHHLFREGAFLYSQGNATVNAVSVSPSSISDRRLVAEGSTLGLAQIYAPMQTGSSTTSDLYVFVRSDTSVFLAQLTLAPSAFTATPKVLTVNDTGSLFTGFVDGLAGVPAAYARSSPLTLNRFAVGALVRGTPSVFFSGSASEVFVGPLLADSARDALHRNQGAAYGITVS